MNKKKIIIVSIIAVLIISYLIYTIYLLIKEPSDIFTVEEGNVYQEETDIGYIIRDEQVVKGENYKNGIQQIKSEGEKAAKGESIFRYYSQNEEDLKTQIAELDEKIQEAMANQDTILKVSGFDSDVKLIENQIDELVEKLNKTSNITELEEYKKEISELVDKKANIIGEKSNSGSYLKQLQDQRSSLENQLNSGAEYINAPESGIVSYKVDGLEETLTPDNFSTLSKDFLNNLNLKTGQIVATSSECGKIINNFEAYIATISKSEEAKNAKIGDSVDIRLPNNKEIDAEIAYISQENEEETLLVLKINKQIEELTSYRKISFDLIWWSHSGLKVPNQAIAEQDGLNYLVRNRAGYLSKILVKVEYQNEKYSIVSNYDTEELRELGFTESQINSTKTLSVYDEIILNPDLSKVE
mgnify:FL=1